MLMSEERLEAFMREPNIAVLSTVGLDGRPHQAPVWHLWEDGISYVFTRRRSRKWRNLLGNSEVSLCIDRNDVPYAYVLVQGTAAESDRSLHEAVRKMANIYYEPDRAAEMADRYRDGDPEIVLVAITPESVISWEQPESD